MYIGDTIARLGDGNGLYPTAAHLHFEMRRNNSLTLGKDPYYNPLSITDALKYSSPSLFIDDRNRMGTLSLTHGSWSVFPAPEHAPSSTAFIEYSGIRHSLSKASNLQWIYQYVYVWQNNRWESFSDITQVWFEKDRWYAVYGFVDGATLNILFPGNNYQKDRALIDMVRTLATNINPANPQFTTIQPEYTTTQEDANFVYYNMPFVYNDGNGNKSGYVWQATQKSLPMIRWESCDNPTGQPLGWRRIDINVLD